ncbi:6549_t:CDS:2, partial [Racocetra persica]
TAKPTSQDDIKLIAKSLVVEDVDKITVYDLLLYDQIITAFRKLNNTELQYKKEIIREEDKMQEIEITVSNRSIKAKSSKKRRQHLEEKETEEKVEEEKNVKMNDNAKRQETKRT